jgi:hypothetical protein
MTKDGFFSAVQKPDCKPGELEIRARCQADLKALMRTIGVKIRIIKTPKADYLYRIRITKVQWAEYLTEAATNIRYDNFKNASCNNDHDRGMAYMQCWSALYEWQQAIESNTKG